MSLFNGRIFNLSDTALWVVAYGVAYRLDAKRASPRSLDADGIRAVNGEVIYWALWPHSSWWKICDLEDAVLGRNIFGSLSLKIDWFPASRAVDDDEFGPITYDKTPGWGVPIL